MKSVWRFSANITVQYTYFNKCSQWYFHWNATSNSYLHFVQPMAAATNKISYLNDALYLSMSFSLSISLFLCPNVIVKAITEKPSNILLEQRYHKRCIYCNLEWLFSLAWASYYLDTAACQEVFMSHGFVSRFYYRVRLFNALYIMCMSAVAF